MINYLRQLYTTTRNLPDAVKATLVVICAMPGIIITPLLILLNHMAADTAATVALYNFARKSASPEQMPELMGLAAQLFGPSDHLSYLVYTVIGTSLVGALMMFVLLLPAVVEALRRYRHLPV